VGTHMKKLCENKSTVDFFVYTHTHNIKTVITSHKRVFTFVTKKN